MYKFKYSAWFKAWIVINKYNWTLQSSWKNSFEAARVCSDLNKAVMEGRIRQW